VRLITSLTSLIVSQKTARFVAVARVLSLVNFNKRFSRGNEDDKLTGGGPP
jgi:hypothetical protein